MAAEKIKEDKLILEREYTVPLRRKVNFSSRYRRARKAVKVLIAFVARNMRVYDNKEKMVKIDKSLNEEVWQHGIQKPPAKIRVKCKKFESGIVRVELAETPEYVKWKRAKEAKRLEVKVEKKEEKKPEFEKKVDEEKKEEVKEKEQSTVEAGLKHQEQEAKEMKHVAKTQEKGMKIKKNQIQRMALQK